jgi:hypothetical protein
MKYKIQNNPYTLLGTSLIILVFFSFFISYTCKSKSTYKRTTHETRDDLKENITNYSPDVFAEINSLRKKENECVQGSAIIKPWEKQFCLENSNTCYQTGCSNKRESSEKKETSEGFLDWSMMNPPISNGFIPNWFGYLPMGANYISPGLAYQNSLDRIYNPLRYPYRSEAFYEQGWYPNMALPPQVIGCGSRRQGCLGGTQRGIPTIPPMVEISERNIAPVNIMTRGPQGVPQQVGVLYKIFGSLNEIYPLYGRKRFPNSNTWDYYTTVGKNGNHVKVPVITKRKNYNELGSNDVVQIAGNSAKFRVTIYEHDFPQYIPYA